MFIFLYFYFCVLIPLALVFQWMKDDRFIRPEMNPHTFLSENGKLYFSEVQVADAAKYMCITTLVALEGQQLAVAQAEYRNSLGIPFNVQGQSKLKKKQQQTNQDAHMHSHAHTQYYVKAKVSKNNNKQTKTHTCIRTHTHNIMLYPHKVTLFSHVTGLPCTCLGRQLLPLRLYP
jgi:ribosomal protein S19